MEANQDYTIMFNRELKTNDAPYNRTLIAHIEPMSLFFISILILETVQLFVGKA